MKGKLQNCAERSLCTFEFLNILKTAWNFIKGSVSLYSVFHWKEEQREEREPDRTTP